MFQACEIVKRHAFKRIAAQRGGKSRKQLVAYRSVCFFWESQSQRIVSFALSCGSVSQRSVLKTFF